MITTWFGVNSHFICHCVGIKTPDPCLYAIFIWHCTMHTVPSNPSHRRTTVIYAYYEKNSDYANNLRFFLKTGLRGHIDFIFVINGACTVALPEQSNVRIIRRDNIGYDFGAYGAGIGAIENLKAYDHYIFINTSVRGPFIPSYAAEVTADWTRPFVSMIKHDVMLAGCSINITNMEGMDAALRAQGYSPPYPHVQSMVFVLSREALMYLRDTNFFNRPPATSYDDAVTYYEIPMSCRILAHGWNIDCLIPEYHARDYRKLQRADMQGKLMGDPTWKEQCVGRTLHPYETIFIKTNRGASEAEINTLSAVMVSSIEEHFTAQVRSDTTVLSSDLLLIIIITIVVALAAACRAFSRTARWNIRNLRH
jgi:hypothetical protein